MLGSTDNTLVHGLSIALVLDKCVFVCTLVCTLLGGALGLLDVYTWLGLLLAFVTVGWVAPLVYVADGR